MKILLIITSILVILFLVFQVYTVMATRKTNEQPYSVIKKEKEFEIRFYPSVPIATMSSSAKSFKELGSEGFRKLAGYIFGANQDNKSIAMTSPVSMSIEDTASTMSFVMPSGYTLDNLPKPNDDAVKLAMSNEEYVAVISFGGFASDEDIQSYTEALKEILIKNNISYLGSFKYLGYNPPYQLVDRRNEIVVRIQWDKI
ncbi:MAG: heme-binding protein [Bacteroidetes bacterium]|nr:heme-binding protein [Bacteroidota bacterium]